MLNNGNALLARLNERVYGKLAPHLSLVELKQGQVLAETGHCVNRAYFPHTGVISSVVDTLDGAGIETSMIGNDGVFGGLQALDHRKSVNKIVVQVGGSSSAIDSKLLKLVADQSGELRDLLVCYEQFNLAQVQQTAACNALHSVEQRICRWMLRMHELAGSELPLTHEFIGQMMGVRRSSVTTVTIAMQEKGLIAYKRGTVQLLNLHGLLLNACECTEVVRETYRQLLGDQV